MEEEWFENTYVGVGLCVVQRTDGGIPGVGKARGCSERGSEGLQWAGKWASREAD